MLKLILPILLLILFSSSSSLVNGTPLPKEFIVGACNHLPKINQSLIAKPIDLASKANIRYFRNDIGWNSIEREFKNLTWNPAYDYYFDLIEAKNIKKLAIFAYGSKFYDNGNLLWNDTMIQAYGNYTQFVCQFLKGRISFADIWNEWGMNINTTDPWWGKQYFKIVKYVAPLIRQADPDIVILGGSGITRIAMINGFADQLIQYGIMDYVDALSIHPYPFCNDTSKPGNLTTPEFQMQWVNMTSQRLDLILNKSIPLYFSEIGYTTNGLACFVNQTTQAAYLARIYLLAKSIPTVKGIWWYDLVNDGVWANETEHNFGLMYAFNFNLKPSFGAMRAIAPFAANYTWIKTKGMLGDPVYSMYFELGRDQVVALWSTEPDTSKQTHTIQFKLDPRLYHNASDVVITYILTNTTSSGWMTLLPTSDLIITPLTCNTTTLDCELQVQAKFSPIIYRIPLDYVPTQVVSSSSLTSPISITLFIFITFFTCLFIIN